MKRLLACLLLGACVSSPPQHVTEILLPPPMYEDERAGDIADTIRSSFVHWDAVIKVEVDEKVEVRAGSWSFYVQTNCKAGGLVHGCAYVMGDKCVVYVPNRDLIYPPVTLEEVVRHELAHCKGWRH